jgi:hypothetical protein
MYDWLLRGDMVGRCTSADVDDGTREGRVRFNFSEEGRIEIEDVRTGVPFRVELRGRNIDPSGEDDVLAEVAIESLGPLEHRLVEFPASALEQRRRVVGRAIDVDGQPILDAVVTTCIGCDSYVATTALDGSFHLDLASRTPIDVEVAKRGYVPFRARGVNVDSGRPIEARLLRGKDLRVEVVDTTGRPIEVADFEGEIAGFGQPWKIDRDSTGVLTYCDLPPATIRIMVLVGGKKYFATRETHAGTVRIVVPEHGCLEVSWSASTSRSTSRSYQLALRPLGSETGLQTEWTPWPDRVLSHVFANVLPGEYTIGFEVGSEATEEGAESRYAPLHDPVRVTIEAGKTRKVELPPP